MDKIKVDFHYVNISSLPENEIISIFKDNNTKFENKEIGLYLTATSNCSGNDYTPIGIALCSKNNHFYYDFDFYDDTRSKIKSFYSELFNFITENSYRIYCFDTDREIRILYTMFFSFIKLQSTKAYCIADSHKGSLDECLKEYCQLATLKDNIDNYCNQIKPLFDLPLRDILNYVRRKDTSNPLIDTVLKQFKETINLEYRLQHFYGISLGYINPRNLGYYACQNAIANLLILDCLKAKYSKDCYSVYLCNQYLLTMMELSGIFVDLPKLNKQKNILNNIIKNCTLYIEKSILQFKLWQIDNNNYVIPALKPTLKYLIDTYNTDFFLNTDPVTVGLQFLTKFRKDQREINNLIKENYVDYQIDFGSCCEDEVWLSIKKSKAKLRKIGNLLLKEWNIADLINRFSTDNNLSENEAIQHLKSLLLKNQLTNKINLLKTKIKDKHIYDDNNIDLPQHKDFDLNKDDLNILIQTCKPSIMALNEVLNKKDITTPIELNNAILGIVNTFSGDFDLSLEKELPFDLENEILKECLGYNTLSLTDTFDNKAFICLKFMILYRIRNSALKMLNTSVKAIEENTFDIKRIGSTFCYPIEKKEIDIKPKYFSNLSANKCITNRWTTRDHSVFTPEEDSKACLAFKEGDCYLLETDIRDPITHTYIIDGYKFRPYDFIKTTTGYKRVDELSDDDEFDSYWLDCAKYHFNKRCKHNQ